MLCLYLVCRHFMIFLLCHLCSYLYHQRYEIIKNIILSKLGIYNERIYARKCEVKEITQNQSREFINTWHLQNDTNSSIKIGLFYEGELLSVMTFGKRKLFGDNDWEMVRFCNKGGIQIVGGASKLLSQFIKDYKPSKIISFSSHDISNGNVRVFFVGGNR